VISRLVQEGHEVQVVVTPSTFQFIGAAQLEGLSGKKVLSALWENGRAMDHIHLSRWADFGILCPASANLIARLAAGMSDDLVSATLLAWPSGKPLHIFPAMNHQMWSAAVTQENLSKLAERGMTVAPTQNGSLACGEEGFGRMLEVDDIIQRVLTPPLGKILITGGATREPIDGIRFISNVSSGRTAASLAQNLENRGWQVTYLSGEGAAQAQNVQRSVTFSSFSDLDEQLRRELGAEDYSAIIHCAAVSDYSIAAPSMHAKLATREELTLKLKANFKILPRLREYSRNKKIQVIGFKLTHNASEQETLAAAHSLLGANVDLIVANDWSQVSARPDRHPCWVVDLMNSPESHVTLDTLSDSLDQRLRTLRKETP
jgi:phosphopantothenoylcysteine decarboxylase/phosphopantothenate--cysteine ligase